VHCGAIPGNRYFTGAVLHKNGYWTTVCRICGWEYWTDREGAFHYTKKDGDEAREIRVPPGVLYVGESEAEIEWPPRCMVCGATYHVRPSENGEVLLCDSCGIRYTVRNSGRQFVYTLPENGKGHRRLRKVPEGVLFTGHTEPV